MSTEKDRMAGVLANTLLYTEGAQDGLIKLLWERMSDEQKQALTDEAHKAAMERMAKVIESRLYGVGQGGVHGRVNLFARHVEAAVKRTFEAENISGAINDIVREQLDRTRETLQEVVSVMVKTMTGAVMKNIIERADVYAIREGLQVALKGVES